MRAKAWSLRAQKEKDKKKIIFWNWYKSIFIRLKRVLEGSDEKKCIPERSLCGSKEKTGFSGSWKCRGFAGLARIY